MKYCLFDAAWQRQQRCKASASTRTQAAHVVKIDQYTISGYPHIDFAVYAVLSLLPPGHQL
jgi:hypothetical protein